MSLGAIVWALKHAPVDDPQSVLVLVALADTANDDGTLAYPARSKIGLWARCSVRTVARRLKELEEAGLISRGDQSVLDSQNIPRDRQPVVWNLNLSMTRGDTEARRDTPGETARQPGYYDVTAQVSRQDTVGTQTVLNHPYPSLTDRADVMQVCEHLSKRIKEHATRAGAGEISRSWPDDARKLLDLDGVPLAEVLAVIDWAHDSDFWRSNILSPKKLRLKWDTLVLQARRDPGWSDRVVGRADRVSGLVAEGRWSEVIDALGVVVKVPWGGDPLWAGDVSGLRERELKAEWWNAWWEREGSKLL